MYPIMHYFHYLEGSSLSPTLSMLMSPLTGSVSLHAWQTCLIKLGQIEIVMDRGLLSTGSTIMWDHKALAQTTRQSLPQVGEKSSLVWVWVEQCSWLLAIQTTEGRRQDTSWTSSREKRGFWHIQGTNESNGRVYISRFAQLTMQGNCVFHIRSLL